MGNTHKRTQGGRRPSKRITLSHIEGETRIKEPGSIHGVEFVLADCHRSTIFLCDYTSSVTVSNCSESDIFIGPCAGTVTISSSENCSLIVACQQLRLADVSSSSLLLYTNFEPVIERCVGVGIGCFSFFYDQLESQFEEAGLNVFLNRWTDCFDASTDSQLTILPKHTSFNQQKLPPSLVGKTAKILIVPYTNPRLLEPVEEPVEIHGDLVSLDSRISDSTPIGTGNEGSVHGQTNAGKSGENGENAMEVPMEPDSNGFDLSQVQKSPQLSPTDAVSNDVGVGDAHPETRGDEEVGEEGAAAEVLQTTRGEQKDLQKEGKWLLRGILGRRRPVNEESSRAVSPEGDNSSANTGEIAVSPLVVAEAQAAETQAEDGAKSERSSGSVSENSGEEVEAPVEGALVKNQENGENLVLRKKPDLSRVVKVVQPTISDEEDRVIFVYFLGSRRSVVLQFLEQVDEIENVPLSLRATTPLQWKSVSIVELEFMFATRNDFGTARSFIESYLKGVDAWAETWISRARITETTLATHLQDIHSRIRSGKVKQKKIPRGRAPELVLRDTQEAEGAEDVGESAAVDIREEETDEVGKLTSVLDLRMAIDHARLREDMQLPRFGLSGFRSVREREEISTVHSSVAEIDTDSEMPTEHSMSERDFGTEPDERGDGVGELEIELELDLELERERKRKEVSDLMRQQRDKVELQKEKEERDRVFLLERRAEEVYLRRMDGQIVRTRSRKRKVGAGRDADSLLALGTPRSRDRAGSKAQKAEDDFEEEDDEFPSVSSFAEGLVLVADQSSNPSDVAEGATDDVVHAPVESLRESDDGTASPRLHVDRSVRISDSVTDGEDGVGRQVLALDETARNSGALADEEPMK